MCAYMHASMHVCMCVCGYVFCVYVCVCSHPGHFKGMYDDAVVSYLYHVCLIRRRGYYLFHHAILCGFYSRAATN